MYIRKPRQMTISCFHLFQVSRLGKHINELRRKASDRHLANRAKSLVKKWRQLLVVSASPAISAGSTENHVLNGTGNGQTPSKPSSRLTSPMSETPVKCNVGLSPGLRHGGLSSLPSSASTSPGLPMSRPSTPMTCQPVSPYLRNGPPVVANSKRTFQQRCDDDTGPTKNGPVVPDAKRPRLNGKTSDYLIGEDSISSDNNANNLLMSSTEDSMSKAPSRCLTPTSFSSPVVPDSANITDSGTGTNSCSPILDWDAVKLQLGSEYRLPNYWKHPIIQLLL